MKNFTLFCQASLPAFYRKFFILFLILWPFVVFAHPGKGLANETATGKQPRAVVITQQPAAVTVCEGGNASFTVGATGSGTLAYQWQQSSDGGGNWSVINNGGAFSGATTATLFINNVPFNMNGHQYRCIVSDGSISTSAAALLSVNAAPTVQTNNIAVQVCINGSATVTAASYAGISYQWQVNTGSGFTNVTNGGVYSGAATSMLRITGVAASMEGYLYRYMATNNSTGCTAVSGMDTLHVLPYATIVQQPVTTMACPGSDVSLTMVAKGAASVKWQVSGNGASWTDVPENAMYSGTNTTTLNIARVNASMNNYRYRAVLYNALSCPVSSNMVFLFVRPVTTIVTQPASTKVCATDAAVFRVVASGTSLSYQWQTDNGSNGAAWTNITPGGTSSTLTRSNVTMPMNGHRFRVIVNGFCGSVISSEATLQTQRGTWLGATSTDWHTASNWCGGVPDSTTDVLIPAGAPNMPDIISGTGYAKTLTIEASAKLTISGGSAQMSGPFSIQGTVAYTGSNDQPVLPAAHGSLEINGSGKKLLQTSTDVYNDLILGGSAKLVTSNYILIMKTGSHPINGANLLDSSESWVVTGNGNAGSANTGTGGLQFEAIRPQDGSVLFPVGPTDLAYNPLFLENKGVADRFLVAVNDQPIPGSFAGRTINRTWKVTEGVPGGSKITLDLKWNKPEEQAFFDSSNLVMVRSASSIIVENKTVRTPGGRPFARTNTDDFVELTAFSLQTVTGADEVPLPVKLLSFSAKKEGDNSALLFWSVGTETEHENFVVQKSSVNNQSFSDIGEIRGEAGKTGYRFTDHQLTDGINYYRLKILNSSGGVAFSAVASLVKESGSYHFELHPSITSTSTRLVFSLPSQQQLTVALVSASGQVQWIRTVRTHTGENTLSIDLSPLSKGIYFVHVRKNGQPLKQLPLVKQ